MRILLSDFLTLEGYDIIEATNGKEALSLFASEEDIKLVILDVMMPYYNGFQVCQKIREKSKLPIIILTAKDTDTDELLGFTHGADDYIKKPISLPILVARVNSLLQRSYGSSETITLECGDLTLYPAEHRAKIGDDYLTLSETEFRLLSYFIENKSVALSRDQLLDKVWGYDYEGSDRTIDTHINRLRSKLKDCQHYIQTVRGLGYRFEVTS